MPDIEIQSLELKHADNKLINDIVLYSKFTCHEELYKILTYDLIDVPVQDEPLLYLSKASQNYYDSL